MDRGGDGEQSIISYDVISVLLLMILLSSKLDNYVSIMVM